VAQRLRSGRLLAWLCGSLWLAPALAHLMPSQQGTVSLLGASAYCAINLPVSALASLGVDTNHDGRWSAAEIEAQTRAIQQAVQQRLRLQAQGQSTRLDFIQTHAQHDEPDGPTRSGATHFLVLLKVSFDTSPQALQIETDLFGSGPGEGQLSLKVMREADTELALLTPAHPRHRFFQSPGRVFLDYVEVGVEHILLGFDHLLFLLTLIVAAAGWRYWLSVITSFTVAHSLTLTAALLGWLSLPSAVVEPLIAASIVLMALLNLRPGPTRVRERVPIVFACGLLHGLGFASAVADLGLHGRHQLLSVLGFNLGIEAGQALFLAALLLGGALAQRLVLRLPIAWAQRVAAWDGRRISSVVAALVASYWLVERLLQAG